MDAELLEETGEVVPHRVHGQVELGGDLRGCLTGGQELEDLELPLREALGRVSGRPAGED